MTSVYSGVAAMMSVAMPALFTDITVLHDSDVKQHCLFLLLLLVRLLFVSPLGHVQQYIAVL